MEGRGIGERDKVPWRHLPALMISNIVQEEEHLAASINQIRASIVEHLSIYLQAVNYPSLLLLILML